MTTTMTDLQTGRTFVFNEALPGRDAYETALAEGFTGTRAAWLASLTGPAGADAYAVAVAEGFTGTRAAWLASLTGPAGPSVTVTTFTDLTAFNAATAGPLDILVLIDA